jgi:hypothetical protein
MAKNEVGSKKIKNISRPGIHSKTKNSNSKTSKNYVKKYAGQGR